VIAARAAVMACQRRSSVRAAFVRTIDLLWDQHASMGEKSGEYGGSKKGPDGAFPSCCAPSACPVAT
jgi:hypothetical protein